MAYKYDNLINEHTAASNSSTSNTIAAQFELNEVTVTDEAPEPIKPRPAGFIGTSSSDVIMPSGLQSQYPQTTSSRPLVSHESQEEDNSLYFYLPKYGYSDYINNLSSWQKQIRDINGDIGWFYFKLFFNFDSKFGLLGGVIDKINAQNTALQYLDSISGDFQYHSCKISDRKLALCKFVNMLKHISIDLPWYFKTIDGLASLKYPYTSEFQKEKLISIECSEEAADMKIGTLLDLYKYACYDHINSREIIPANLRKFDMSLIIMHVPLKYHHEPTVFNGSTGIYGNKGKSLNMNEQNKFSTLASFKMFTFQNCEINLDGAGEYYSGGVLSNESPFQMGKIKLKIQYDRVYEHRMNEWNEFLLGDDGFYYNNEIPFELKSNDINNFLVNPEFDNSTHRQILSEINSNRISSGNFLLSYSDYFLNKIWNGIKYNALIEDFRRQSSYIKENYNSIADSYKRVGSAWSNLFGGSENP